MRCVKKKLSGKMVFFLLSMLCLCALLIQPVYAAAGDEIRAPKKIISMVYDDSGSMSGEPWGYANYAAQALTALLNEQDELYITYLSHPKKSVEINLKSIDQALAEIHDWDHCAGTPGVAIETAREKLDQAGKSDEEAEYWLIVMTDGQFDTIYTPNDLQNTMAGMAGNRMPNQSRLHVVYFGMGSSAYDVTEDIENDLYSFHPQSDADIVTSMSEAANLVSGRVVVTNAVQVDDRTVRFQSDLPLYSISVLSQQSVARVESAATQEEPLHVVRNAAVNAQNLYSISLDLFGNAAIINREDASGKAQVIPRGEYTLSFSEPVTLESLVIQFEPAIGLKTRITRDGIEVDVSRDELYVGDKLAIEYIPIVPGTSEEIPLTDLPNGMTWSISAEVEGKEVSHVEDRRLTDFEVKEGHTDITFTMEIPGFADTTQKLSFDVSEPKVVIGSLGIEVVQPDDLVYPRSTLNRKFRPEERYITFRLTNDGVALTAEELDQAGLSLQVANVSADESTVASRLVRLFGIRNGSAALQRNDDGSFTLLPKAAWRIPLLRPFTCAGDYEVTVAVSTGSGVSETGRYHVSYGLREWIDFIILWILILLFAYVIHTAFIREKFPNCSVQYARITQAVTSHGNLTEGRTQPTQKLGLAQSLWPPFRANSTCKCKANPSLTLVAEHGGVFVRGESLARSGNRCIGVYPHDLPKAADEIPFSDVSSVMAETVPDRQGKIHIGDKKIPTTGLLIFGASPESAGLGALRRLR